MLLRRPIVKSTTEQKHAPLEHPYKHDSTLPNHLPLLNTLLHLLTSFLSHLLLCNFPCFWPYENCSTKFSNLPTYIKTITTIIEWLFLIPSTQLPVLSDVYFDLCHTSSAENIKSQFCSYTPGQSPQNNSNTMIQSHYDTLILLAFYFVSLPHFYEICDYNIVWISLQIFPKKNNIWLYIKLKKKYKHHRIILSFLITLTHQTHFWDA